MADLLARGRVVGRFVVFPMRADTVRSAARAVFEAFPRFDPILGHLAALGGNVAISRELSPWERLLLLVRNAACMVNAWHGGKPPDQQTREALELEMLEGVVAEAGSLAWLLDIAAPELAGALHHGGLCGEPGMFGFNAPGLEIAASRRFGGPIPFTPPQECVSLQAWYDADMTAGARAAVDAFESYAETWAEEADPSATSKPIRLLLAIVEGVARELSARHPEASLEALRSDVVGQVAALYGDLLTNLVGPGGSAELVTMIGGRRNG